MTDKFTIKNNSRYDWVDVLKALGIIAIYYGHSIHPESRLHLFFFTYHVPLFFFASGFFAVKENNCVDKQGNMRRFVKKKFAQIMVPYFFFSIIFLLVYVIGKRPSVYNIMIMIKQVFFGIRNQLPADSLWFLPCIFVMSIIYEMLYRTFKTKGRVLFYSFVLFSMTQVFFPFNPLKSPRWILNFDSALYYLIYYSIGAYAFQYIKDMKYKDMDKKEKIYFFIITGMSLIITSIVYYKDPDKMLDDMFLGRFSRGMFVLIIALIMIYLNVILSHILKSVKFLRVIGSSTLILCGTEQLLKVFLTLVFIKININVTSNTYVMGAFFNFACFTVSYFVVIPIMSKVMGEISSKINRKMVNKI
ncbi:Fucose 4-O-acetylase [Hathewaya proteolytica DSM 3090]|uniref:Fucose 4-O-acetylase n=1 Tax=Hathewaya proteolytica DSM 3090 TaxID=1121331 RepID=A0A1M6PJA9_9CLOT|nr:acyltransferase [Hathewaya proteolytica]SHK08026.1 Fucose 4-O-acetylase [Hathewaya proteolytica DSM 3090]